MIPFLHLVMELRGSEKVPKEVLETAKIAFQSYHYRVSGHLTESRLAETVLC